MTKRLQSKHKLSRRYGVNLWGQEKSPVNVRNYPAGQHGPKGTWKPTDYGLQLAAKQKLRNYYGDIGERQFRNLFREAVRRKGDTSENFLESLERMLVTVVYRLGFAPTVFSARQLVNHGHVRVNGKRVDRPSYRLSDGDVVSIEETMRGNPLVTRGLEAQDKSTPSYLSFDSKEAAGIFVRAPEASEIPYPVQMSPHLVIGYYSR